jgi:hypothetical protein
VKGRTEREPKQKQHSEEENVGKDTAKVFQPDKGRGGGGYWGTSRWDHRARGTRASRVVTWTMSTGVPLSVDA